jgi:hypothetical protein
MGRWPCRFSFPSHPASYRPARRLPRMKSNRYSVFRLFALPCICFPLASVFAADQSLPTFLKSYCVDCHNSDTMEGQVRLAPLIDDPDAADPSLLHAVFDVVSSGTIPPEDESQPEVKERDAFVAFIAPILRETNLKLMEKAFLPGHGNLVSHERLFTEPEVRRAATPARLWRMSPHLFMQRANHLTRSPFLVPRRNQGGDGLHPERTATA